MSIFLYKPNQVKKLLNAIKYVTSTANKTNKTKSLKRIIG